MIELVIDDFSESQIRTDQSTKSVVDQNSQIQPLLKSKNNLYTSKESDD